MHISRNRIAGEDCCDPSVRESANDWRVRLDPAFAGVTEPPTFSAYWGTPSTTKARNFAYFSPIFRAALKSAEARQA
jgi:hypothetical protein